MNGWKVVTHDGRPPVQGGDPMVELGGVFPQRIGPVKLDLSDVECGAGFNFCRDAHTALRIAGLWPDGRPSVLLHVRGGKDTVERGDKLRSSRLSILEVCDEETVRGAVSELSVPFGEHRFVMAESQMEWWEALSRPDRDSAAVERGLRDALAARGLEWELRQFDATRDAWDAWAAWAAWDARAAWDVGAALTLQYVALQGWTDHDPLLLTTGLRDAYRHGLAVAVPSGPDTLGWAMVER